MFDKTAESFLFFESEASQKNEISDFVWPSEIKSRFRDTSEWMLKFFCLLRELSKFFSRRKRLEIFNFISYFERKFKAIITFSS